MHEVSFCRDMLGMVERTMQSHCAQEVKTVTVRLGRFAHVTPEALRFCFSAVSDGTPVANAELKIIVSDAVGLCSQCGNQQTVTERFVSCNRCGHFPMEIHGADDMVLQSIEVI